MVFFSVRVGVNKREAVLAVELDSRPVGVYHDKSAADMRCDMPFDDGD